MRAKRGIQEVCAAESPLSLPFFFLLIFWHAKENCQDRVCANDRYFLGRFRQVSRIGAGKCYCHPGAGGEGQGGERETFFHSGIFEDGE